MPARRGKSDHDLPADRGRVEFRQASKAIQSTSGAPKLSITVRMATASNCRRDGSMWLSRDRSTQPLSKQRSAKRNSSCRATLMRAFAGRSWMLGARGTWSPSMDVAPSITAVWPRCMSSISRNSQNPASLEAASAAGANSEEIQGNPTLVSGGFRSERGTRQENPNGSTDRSRGSVGQHKYVL